MNRATPTRLKMSSLTINTRVLESTTTSSDRSPSPLLKTKRNHYPLQQVLESTVIDHRVRLIVLDSVAALARADFAPGSLVERQRMLGQQVRGAVGLGWGAAARAGFAQAA